MGRGLDLDTDKIHELSTLLGFRDPAELSSFVNNLQLGNDYEMHGIPRRNNSSARRIVSPRVTYDRMIKELRRYLEKELEYSAPEYVTGFVKGKSTKTNAMYHLNKDCVLRLDIHHFFDSISRARIEKALAESGLCVGVAKLSQLLHRLKVFLVRGLE